MFSRPLPEGLHRIAVVLGLVGAAIWMVWIASESDGFTDVRPIGWFIIVVEVVVVGMAPGLVIRVGRWVLEGFKDDAD